MRPPETCLFVQVLATSCQFGTCDDEKVTALTCFRSLPNFSNRPDGPRGRRTVPKAAILAVNRRNPLFRLVKVAWTADLAENAPLSWARDRRLRAETLDFPASNRVVSPKA